MMPSPPGEESKTAPPPLEIDTERTIQRRNSSLDEDTTDVLAHLEASPSPKGKSRAFPFPSPRRNRLSSDDNRFRRGLGKGNALLFPFGDGDASRCAKTSVVSSSNDELRRCIVRSVSISRGGGAVLDSSSALPGGEGIIARSQAPRALA